MRKLYLKFKPYWRNIISPTIVATLILIVTIWLFGLENSMIGPFATISYMRVINMKNHYECMIKHFIRYGITAVAAYLAVMNLPLCIIINAAALFVMTFYLIDEYHPENHLPIGMALIFFQISQIHTPMELLKRECALAAAFVIIFAFVLIITLHDRRKDRFSKIIDKGFVHAERLIAASRQADEEKIRSIHLDLRKTNRMLSEEIYAYNRATFKRKGSISFYCRFVILFQVINYLTRNYKEKGNVDRAEQMLSDYKKLLTEYQPESDYWMLNLRSDRLNYKDFQFRYALRMVIAMTPCMVFGYLTDIPNAYWLAFSLFYMLTPSSDDTMRSVYRRTAGTLAGILMSLVLFLIFPDITMRIIITAVLNLFIYSAKNYIFSVAYITCATLAMQTVDLNTGGAMLRCVIFTVAGALIAVFVNRFVFPVHTSVQISLILEYLKKIRKTLKQISNHAFMSGEESLQIQKEYLLSDGWQHDEIQRRHLTDQLCIRSYLMTARLQELDESRPEDKRMVYFDIEKEHMNFMASLLLDSIAKPGRDKNAEM